MQIQIVEKCIANSFYGFIYNKKVPRFAASELSIIYILNILNLILAMKRRITHILIKPALVFPFGV
ncbi:hypothetical protein ABIB62_004271 [Mucilaginibacter sp. UYP25]